MRKIVFMLKVNSNPNSVTPKNLEISTHKGARLKIIGNQATVLDVTNDEMSDSELQTWYRSRYSGLGMGITIMRDSESKIHQPVVNTENEIKVESVKDIKVEVKTEKPKAKRTKKETKKQPEVIEIKEEVKEVKQDNFDVKESTVVAKVEPKEVEISGSYNTETSDVQSEASIQTDNSVLTENTEGDAGAFADLQSFLWS